MGKILLIAGMALGLALWPLAVEAKGRHGGHKGHGGGSHAGHHGHGGGHQKSHGKHGKGKKFTCIPNAQGFCTQPHI